MSFECLGEFDESGDREEKSDKMFLFNPDTIPSTPSVVSWIELESLSLTMALRLLFTRDLRGHSYILPDSEHIHISSPNVSYIAYDTNKNPKGFLIAHVANHYAFLHILYIYHHTNIHTVGDKLIYVFQEKLGELGVDDATGKSPISDVEIIKIYLELGFYPERVLCEDAVIDRPLDMALDTDIATDKYTHTKTTRTNTFPSTTTHIPIYVLWTLPLTYENGKNTYVLERVGILQEVLIPNALESLNVEGIIPLVSKLEVVLGSETDEGTRQKAQGFVDKCHETAQRLNLRELTVKEYVFIAKTVESDSRILGVATARLEEDGILGVPWLFVSSQCEGYATLLLAEEILETARNLGVSTGVMFLPASAVPAWRSAFAAGFTVDYFYKDEMLYLLTSDSKSQMKYESQDYRAQQRLEYRLEALHAQRTGAPEIVKALSTSERFSTQLKESLGILFPEGDPEKPEESGEPTKRKEIRRPKDSGEPKKPTTAPEECKKSQMPKQPKERKELKKPTVPEKLDERESSGISGAQLAVAGGLLFFYIYLAITLLRNNRRFALRRQEGLNLPTELDMHVGGPKAASWEWRTSPEQADDERSSELDDFIITTRDSDSFTQPSFSL